MTTTIESLLPGRALTTPEGSLGFCGTYLVTTGGRGSARCRVVFDPGHVGRRAALVSQLAQRGLGPMDIDVVVLSHAHWDHAQNVDLFPRASVRAHTDELQDVVAGSVQPRDAFTPTWTSAMLSGAAAARDGEPIAAGVDILHLPGHTRGSIGLRVQTPSGVAVLTGDAISRRDVAGEGRCASPLFDDRSGRRSVRRVLAIADEIWPGHDRPFAVANGEVGDYLTAKVPVVLHDHAVVEDARPDAS